MRITRLITSPTDAMIAFAKAAKHDVGNMQPIGGVFPDYAVPIVRNSADGRSS